MRARTTTPLLGAAAASILAIATLTSAPSSADQSADRARSAPSAQSTGYAVVMLRSPAAASYQGGIDGLARTKPTNGRLDTGSAAYRAYRRHLAREHAAFRSYLRQSAPRASVTREYFAVANAVAVRLNGTSTAALAKAPKVRWVAESALYRSSMNVSNDLIRASEVWAGLGGQANAGDGVDVAIIDSGIDLTNPFFDDSGLPAAPQADRCADQDGDPATPDTNNKVVVCQMFFSGVSSAAPPVEEDEPLLCNDHGTHVAGTVAGRAGTSGPVEGTDVVLTDLSGVAPGARLGSYNVFPCRGAGFTAFDGSAFSHDIAAAIEQALLDGMDVANMSLGGTVQGPHDFLADAADAAVEAGMVLVISAGNEGPGDSTVGSPGSAPNAITAGASTNPHFIGVPVTVTGGPTIGGATGDFDPFTEPVTAPYTATTPTNGCSAVTTNLTGRIALIDRGVCSFTTKIRNAENAGAIGVLIVNNVAGDPTAMGADGTTPVPEIPALMVGKVEGDSIKPSGEVSIDGTAAQEVLTQNEDIIAGFSSRGPTPFTALIKPDLTGPGVNIASSVFGGEFAFFQGTSMAAPHLSGVAALLLDEFPTASPAEVKSRMVNNAARVVTDHVTGTVDPGVLARGGGRVDVVEAFAADSWFAPVSASFGIAQGKAPFTVTRVIEVNGSPASDATVHFFAAPPAGVTLEAVLSDGGTTLTLTMSVGKSVPGGDVSGDVAVVAVDGDVYLVPFWVRVDR